MSYIFPLLITLIATAIVFIYSLAWLIKDMIRRTRKENKDANNDKK